MRLPFPLQDGQWKLEVIGDVSEKYLSRLTLGRQSLEFERNIFYACTESGRRVEVSDAIPLGSTLWWLRRSPLSANEPKLARISIELHAQTNGWRVYLVSLPEIASSAEIAAFSYWFQRRVRPRRPAVWVASPWPRQILQDNTALFAITDGPLCWQADQEIDLRILARNTGRVVANISNTRQVTWETVETGDWDVEVNQVVVGAIQIVPSAPAAAAGIACELSDGRTFDFVDLQRHGNALLAAGASSISGELRWANTAVGGLLYVNDRRVTSPTSSIAFKLEGRLCVTADKLGCANFCEAPISEADRQVCTPAEYEPLARWLLSVGSMSQDPARIRLDASSLPAGCSRIVQQLARLSWPPSLAAQVRWLGRALGDRQ